jgi:opacity protein-like surface antigen
MRPALPPAVIAVLVSTALVSSTPAVAQVPESGGRVYALGGAAVGDGEHIGIGVGAGLRMTRHIGLDVELVHLSGEREDWPHPWFGVSTFAGAEDYPALGAYIDDLVDQESKLSVTTFLTRFTVEFPIADGRLFPYLGGGGGLGRTTEHYYAWPEDMAQLDGPPGLDELSVFPFWSSQSTLGLALTLGGGVDVRLWRGLGVGTDIRWLRVLHSYEILDLAQATARLSYRF